MKNFSVSKILFFVFIFLLLLNQDILLSLAYLVVLVGISILLVFVFPFLLEKQIQNKEKAQRIIEEFIEKHPECKEIRLSAELKQEKFFLFGIYGDHKERYSFDWRGDIFSAFLFERYFRKLYPNIKIR